MVRNSKRKDLLIYLSPLLAKPRYNCPMEFPTRPSRYPWLLFDADDTLFDYQSAEAQALTGVFAHFELPFLPNYPPVYAAINHSYWQRFEAGTISLADLRTHRFRDLLAELHIPLDASLFSQVYLDQLGQSAVLLPGVQETLSQLAPAHKMAIITNGISQVQRSRLSLSPIAHFFDHIFISEEIGVSKPAQGFFDNVFQQIGQPASADVLVIGDSLSSDIRGGAAYGLDTCWFNPRKLPRPAVIKPTYEIQSLVDLISIC